MASILFVLHQPSYRRDWIIAKELVRSQHHDSGYASSKVSPNPNRCAACKPGLVPSAGLYLAIAAVKVARRIHAHNNEQYHIIDASYDLSVSNENANMIQPLSWESILLPVGNRQNYFVTTTGHERLIVFYDWFNPGNLASHFCITIDHTKTWNGDTLDRWLSSFRETKIGASVLEAIAPLPLPAGWSPLIKLLPRGIPHLADREILSILRAGTEGIIQRWLAPPCLKRVAAESFFKANPRVKLSEVKEATGVDVSDGVREESDHAVNVVYLT